MRRYAVQPRDNWQKTVESQGLIYHSVDARPYWDESAYYQFTLHEIAQIERATYALNDMCLTAAQHVIDADRLAEFQIPETHRQWVRESWDRDEFTLYGRFDLAYDGYSPPKMLEYNADTPTSLLEAAIVQWFWLKDRFPKLDQFNSIHERLIEAWQRYAPTTAGTMHFAAIGESPEDFMNVAYLRETAEAAGLKAVYLDITEIGWDAHTRSFVDMQNRAMHSCFKLYPWEWMTHETFAPNLLTAHVNWLEAPWKMLLSNKAILVVLSELFPDSPYLLKAGYEPPAGDYVRKPLLSREGANVQIIRRGQVDSQTDGPYEGPYVYQQRAALPHFSGGGYPILGSWMINGHAAGIGIREDASPITGNTSRFVPHVIVR